MESLSSTKSIFVSTSLSLFAGSGPKSPVSLGLRFVPPTPRVSRNVATRSALILQATCLLLHGIHAESRLGFPERRAKRIASYHEQEPWTMQASHEGYFEPA